MITLNNQPVKNLKIIKNEKKLGIAALEANRSENSNIINRIMKNLHKN